MALPNPSSPGRVPKPVGAFALAAICLALASLAPQVRAAEIGVPVRIELGADEPELSLLLERRIDVDAVFDGWARVYVTASQRAKLERLGFRASLLPDTSRQRAAELRRQPPQPKSALGGGVPAVYHNYATLTADLQAIAADHPDIARLSSIGQSEQGRELWMMKLSDNPDVDEDEPELSYISSMHGDEVVGKELTYNLIEYLTDNYGTDPRATALVDGAEIWIMPSMNPDGTELGQRWNANNVDLNRNFPDQFVDPVNSGVGREAETAAVIDWSVDRRITISANFHGGVLVANYPFDGNPEGASVFSPSPDQDSYVFMARTYADNNPPMSISNAHPAWDNGITNGADWFAINGGMQDWNYVWNGAFEILMELGNVKWPPGSELPTFWAENQESMLSYLELGFRGLRGIVTDAATGQPVSASVTIDSNPLPSYTDPAVGDYHRFMVPGTYSVTFDAVGYQPKTVNSVTVSAGAAARLDVTMTTVAANLQQSDDEILDGGGGNGWLDPGEAADLALTLDNLGGSATGVNATLEPAGWFSEIIRAQADYPDIGPGGSGQSLSPHHRVEITADIPAGYKPGFVLRWQAADAAGVSEPFFLPVGEPHCATVAATDLPAAINDFAVTTSQLEFVEAWEIAEVRVQVDLTHTYIGDLDLELIAPGGQTVRLHDNGGGAADDIQGTYGADLTPVDPLSALAGEPAAGDWQLRIEDSGPGDVGTLAEFGVEVCGRPVLSATPEIRLADLRAEAGEATVEWWPYPGLTSYRVYRSTDPSAPGRFINVTGFDDDPSDTRFTDGIDGAVAYYLVTGIGPLGEGPKGHFGE